MCVLLPIDYGCLRVGVLHASMYGNHEQPNNQKRKARELDLEERGGEGGGWERKRKGGEEISKTHRFGLGSNSATQTKRDQEREDGNAKQRNTH